ncbi:hypothetical protein GGI24_003063, partial [Coemansia furcata]
LHPMDPPPWCDAQMTLTLPNVHSFQLPDPSWQWVSPRWLIDMTRDVDDDGWQYAARFSGAWHGRHSAQAFVRRRRWLRLRRRLRCAVGDDDVDMCLNSAVALEAAGGGRAQPMIRAAASKIKSKVSGNYVGSSPRSPTSPTARALAYTLKDGKYRSHNLKSPPPPPIPPLPPTHALPSHTNSVSSSAQPSLHNSSDTPKPAASSVAFALDASDVSDVPLAHKCRHHSSTQAAVEPLPLPTGGFAAVRLHPHELLSATGSVAAATDVSSAGEEEPPAGYASFLPRLVALAPPESTVPLGGFARSHSAASPQQQLQQPALMAAALRRRQTSPPMVRSLVLSDEDAGSTVVASQTDMRQESPSFSLRRKMSVASSLSRLAVSRPHSVASMEYLDNDLAPMDAYVDPYAPLQLPYTSPGADDGEWGGPVDARLVEVATATLKQMLAGVRLDRERLDILRGGLLAGGVTAATIWYALGWLHYDLMQYDHGRQQLIAMLLAFSHTCPRDAPLKYGGELMGVVSPSEVWRRVVRPAIEMDADLFYSDFKLMAMGVARWNLLKTTGDARG